MKDYTIILKPQITLIGIACHTSNAEDAGPKDIPAHWDRFYKENIFNKIPDKAHDSYRLYSKRNYNLNFFYHPL